MKIYLCASYHRRVELRGYAAQLVALGHTITSTWITTDDDEAALTPEKLAEIAVADIGGLLAASTVIVFTEPPVTVAKPRGGRHTEFGYALAAGHNVLVVGPRENVFHNLPGVRAVDTWESAVAALPSFTDRTRRRIA